MKHLATYIFCALFFTILITNVIICGPSYDTKGYECSCSIINLEILNSTSSTYNVEYDLFCYETLESKSVIEGEYSSWDDANNVLQYMSTKTQTCCSHNGLEVGECPSVIPETYSDYVLLWVTLEVIGAGILTILIVFALYYFFDYLSRRKTKAILTSNGNAGANSVSIELNTF
jgi:hypothetical protein